MVFKGQWLILLIGQLLSMGQVIFALIGQELNGLCCLVSKSTGCAALRADWSAALQVMLF